jgi:CDP-2,3-bis-(O-geranylgeranyl)-sn-glycerol synthase
MNELIDYLILATPAFTANGLPVLFAKLKWLEKLNYPLDAYKTYRRKRVFGDHKTLRGLIVGVLAGTIMGIALYYLKQLGVISISQLESLAIFTLYGGLAGFGAMLGDTLESFFKRQLAIPSGRPFLPFDQIDYIIGFLIATSPLISWNLNATVFLLLCGLIINPLANLIAYVTGIKPTFW